MKIEYIIEHKKSTNVKDILYKNELYTYFDEGNTRRVFVNKDKTKVIKVLVSEFDYDFNREEAAIYKGASKEQKEMMAKTVVDYDGFVVEQEFCNPIKFDERPMTIAQTMFAMSCRNEVGWTDEGKLVCFDLDEFKKH